MKKIERQSVAWKKGDLLPDTEIEDRDIPDGILAEEADKEHNISGRREHQEADKHEEENV